ncbi:MAG: peptide chain release factor N(5)-glutamine methyltransferase [Piscirickettsiaceae bacterium]|nr:peptide chain release factor N(5)-glutamine methyltransferase [Piscirickettsiaceae bacterium]
MLYKFWVDNIMNIKQALDYGRSIIYGKLGNNIDSNVLLCHVLHCDTTYLHMWPNKPLTSIQKKMFEDYIQKRLFGVPVAYITGTSGFWSLDLKVTKDTLIPREDTEMLVTLALDVLESEMIVIDLGTGAGAIALSLATERPNANILASDHSWSALKVARMNALENKLYNVSFIQANWLTSIKDKAFNIVISNPPYLIEDDVHLSEGDVRFEPIKALTSGRDGLTDIRIIVKQAYTRLKEHGWLFVEHGYHQANEVSNIFFKAGFKHVSSHRDYGNNNRIIVGQLRSTI